MTNQDDDDWKLDEDFCTYIGPEEAAVLIRADDEVPDIFDPDEWRSSPAEVKEFVWHVLATGLRGFQQRR